MTDAYFHIASIPYQPGQRFFAPLPEDIQPEVTERVEAGTQVVIYRLSKKWFCSPAYITSVADTGHTRWQVSTGASLRVVRAPLESFARFARHLYDYGWGKRIQLSTADMVFVSQRLAGLGDTLQEALANLATALTQEDQRQEEIRKSYED